MLDGYEVDLLEDLRDTTDLYDVVVVQAEGELDGETVAQAVVLGPTLAIADVEELMGAVDAGCRGFLPETSSLEEIRDGVNTIIRGGAVVPPELLGSLLGHLVERRRHYAALSEQLDVLTDRERQVFRLAAQGARKEEIGQRLFISPATARTHLQNVYRKMGVHSQPELIALAARIQDRRPEET